MFFKKGLQSLSNNRNKLLLSNNFVFFHFDFSFPPIPQQTVCARRLSRLSRFCLLLYLGELFLGQHLYYRKRYIFLSSFPPYLRKVLPVKPGRVKLNLIRLLLPLPLSLSPSLTSRFYFYNPSCSLLYK